MTCFNSETKINNVQFEKCCSQLQKENMWQTMLVYNKNTLNWSTHSYLGKFFPHPCKSGLYWWILFIERFLCSECVVCEWITENKIQSLKSKKRLQRSLRPHKLYTIFFIHQGQLSQWLRYNFKLSQTQIYWVPLTMSSVTASTQLYWADFFASHSLTAMLKRMITTSTHL